MKERWKINESVKIEESNEEKPSKREYEAKGAHGASAMPVSQWKKIGERG